MRTAKITTTATIKFNTGNFETIEVMKSVETEVTFEKPEELTEKSKNMDKMIVALLKDEAQFVCEQSGRQRIVKVGGVEKAIGLFDAIGGDKK